MVLLTIFVFYSCDFKKNHFSYDQYFPRKLVVQICGLFSHIIHPFEWKCTDICQREFLDGVSGLGKEGQQSRDQGEEFGAREVKDQQSAWQCPGLGGVMVIIIIIIFNILFICLFRLCQGLVAICGFLVEAYGI